MEIPTVIQFTDAALFSIVVSKIASLAYLTYRILCESIILYTSQLPLQKFSTIGLGLSTGPLMMQDIGRRDLRIAFAD